ncbi:hypothetical protein Tco_0577691 [Tanacetum coccineum]
MVEGEPPLIEVWGQPPQWGSGQRPLPKRIRCCIIVLVDVLSILTVGFAEQDFLIKLPRRLMIGLAALFISTTAMIIAFAVTLFFVFGKENSWMLIPICALTCLPITSFVPWQFPLVADLISATYGRSIFVKEEPDKYLY